jgi:phosphohistidine phosphatase SixA
MHLEIIQMGRRVYLFALMILCLAPTILLSEDTVVFVIRHAEKEGDTGDPPLSAKGKKRAAQLKETLKNLRLDKIYYTSALRAKETAQPLVDSGIAHDVYTTHEQTWIDSMLAENSGKRVLIVGHAPTVHQIVERISGKTTPAIGNRFDNLFVITISGSEKSVVRLSYGESN